MSDTGWPVDAGLLSRFRRAGAEIQWRDEGMPKAAKGRPTSPRLGTVRVAHFNDEEARVEVRTSTDVREVITDSGPLGALILVLEIDERGVPGSLTQHPAHELTGFGSGAIRARWSPSPRDEPGKVPLSDIVGLARYALP